MNPDLQTALNLHQLWLAGDPSGTRFRSPATDFTGTDFTGYSLSQVDIRHSDLTNCIMAADCSKAVFTTIRGTNVDWSNSDITDTNFEMADISGFNFIGATWRGVRITNQPAQIADTFWTMLTNAFIQIGCKQYTFAQWCAMTDDDLLQLDGQKAVDWWHRNLTALKTINQQFT